MADMTYTEDQVRALREALTSGVLIVSAMTARASPTAQSTRSRQRWPRSRTPAPAMPAGRCARSVLSPTRDSKHGLVLANGRVLARAPRRRGSFPPADPRGRGLGPPRRRLVAGQPRRAGGDLRHRPRPPGQVARSGAPQRLGRQRGGRLRHQLHRHRHQAAVDRDGRGVPGSRACAVVGLVRRSGRRRHHRLLRPAGARLPGHAGRRRVLRALEGAPARGRSRGAPADPAPGGRARAAHLQHDTAERQPGARRHRVRPARPKAPPIT